MGPSNLELSLRDFDVFNIPSDRFDIKANLLYAESGSRSGFDVPGGLVILREQSQPYRQSDQIKTRIQFSDVGLGFVLSPDVNPTRRASWKWSDLDEALVELVGFFLDKGLRSFLIDRHLAIEKCATRGQKPFVT